MRLNRSAVIAAALVLLYASNASAQLEYHDAGTNQGVLDQVVSEFANRAAGWKSIVTNAAAWLFWTLGTISLVWTGGIMVLRKADIGEFFAEFFRFIVFFGFFLWLLRNGPDIAGAIISSLRQVGENAAGITGVSPSGIVDIGFMIWKQAVGNISIWSPIDSFVSVTLSVGILILLAVIAVNMLLMLVASWILMYAGIFFLGFGGSRWTSEMAINYFKTVLGVAVQLFVMVLIVGTGNDLLTSLYSKMTKGALNFEELGVMLVFCVALLMLVNHVPALVAGVISGASIGGAGIGQHGAGMVIGAAVGAAGVAAAAAGMAGAAAVSGLSSIAGGASAIKAAFSKANENVGAGTDALTSMWGGGIGGAGSSGSDSSAGNTSYAEAAGFAGGSSSTASTGVDSGDKSGSGDTRGKSEGGGQTHADQQADSAADGSSKLGGSEEKTQQANQQGGTSTGEKSGGLLASAAKAAGKTAVDAGANLARGTTEVAKSKMASISKAALERIGETTGGKIATAIRAQGNSSGHTNNSQQPARPTFEGNSLAGERQADPESEVAAFRDRDNQPI